MSSEQPTGPQMQITWLWRGLMLVVLANMGLGVEGYTSGVAIPMLAMYTMLGLGGGYIIAKAWWSPEWFSPEVIEDA